MSSGGEEEGEAGATVDVEVEGISGE